MSFHKNTRTRPLLALIVSAALSGVIAACGFQPLHSRIGGADATRLAGVLILPILNREGQILSNLLRDRMTPLGPPRKPVYRLSIMLTESQQSLGIQLDESATRANLKMIAVFHLRSAQGGKALFSGQAQSTSSFNILDSSFATLSAEKDARVRSLRQIADQIKSRVSIFIGRTG